MLTRVLCMIKGINNFMEDPNEQLGKLIYSGYFLTKQKGRSMTQYYSNTKEDYVNINDMHHQHVWYAFKKLCDRLEELGICEHLWEDDYKPLKRDANSKMVFKLEKEVSRLKEQINRMYKDQKHIGHRYVFSNIPNTEEGRQTVHKLKKWLNKDTYNMRVRGQYLDKTKLSEGESWRTYDDGQPLSKSKCIRLYIDKKKESA